MDRHILLNPGPVNLSERVRKAMLQPDLCHRETEFAELQNSIRTNLLNIYKLPKDRWASVLLTGSGTAAVEAMLTSMVPDDGHVLIIENGVYGERMTKMAQTYGIRHSAVKHDWSEAINPGKIGAIVKKENITHVAVVHHETTTGRLNDLSMIAEACKKENIPLLIDGVSSFGAEKINFTNWNIAACAATANKCLHGVPGTAFVIVRRDLINKTNASSRTLYLDLKNYLKSQDTNGTPFTQSVQCFYALAEALNEFKEAGGWKMRQKNYQKRMKIVRDGLIALGIQPLVKEKECSCVLNAFHLPKGITYEQLHDKLKKNGFIIYAGQGKLAKTIFRVSCMGDITENDMRRFVSCVKEMLMLQSKT
ncbi:MAG: 2-aminoethylphosphonate--pyruvate transaminase [Gammaproteobacteria bacterium]|nr:2-aminoethylphosphonate--pyruvate transaminase [Gammaproteobacteria bacterium]